MDKLHLKFITMGEYQGLIRDSQDLYKKLDESVKQKMSAEFKCYVMENKEHIEEMLLNAD